MSYLGMGRGFSSNFGTTYTQRHGRSNVNVPKGYTVLNKCDCNHGQYTRANNYNCNNYDYSDAMTINAIANAGAAFINAGASAYATIKNSESTNTPQQQKANLDSTTQLNNLNRAYASKGVYFTFTDNQVQAYNQQGTMITSGDYNTVFNFMSSYNPSLS